MIRLFLTFSLLVGSSAAAAELKTFESPAGFYSISYPATWKLQRDGNIVNIMPPDERGAVTISAFHSDAGDMRAFLHITREPFARLEAVVKFAPFEKAPALGIAGEFREKEDKAWRYWIVRGVHLRHVFVLITANDIEADFPKRRAEYLSILDSLILREPKKANQAPDAMR